MALVKCNRVNRITFIHLKENHSCIKARKHVSMQSQSTVKTIRNIWSNCHRAQMSTYTVTASIHNISAKDRMGKIFN